MCLLERCSFFFGEFILLLNAGGRTDFHTAPASTETVRTTRDGDQRTATPNFTQLLSSDTSCVFEFSIASRPQRP